MIYYSQLILMSMWRIINSYQLLQYNHQIDICELQFRTVITMILISRYSEVLESCLPLSLK